MESVKSETVQRLLQLNREFYQSFAAPFSATRRRLQPGVMRVLEAIPKDANILDLGCGNGELARELARRGQKGMYVGLDFSAELLDEAKRDNPLNGSFLQADITQDNWESKLPIASYQFIFCFAVLHHIPGEETRLAFLRKVGSLLAPGGRFIHSNWQFLNSERLRERIRLWARAGLSDADVDSDDYLLDWRRDGEGLRYVHHFSEDELTRLAAETGFKVVETFYSDGEGGKLGLYGVWELNR